MPTHSLGGGGPVGVGAPRPWRARPTLLSFSTNRGRPSWPAGGRRGQVCAPWRAGACPASVRPASMRVSTLPLQTIAHTHPPYTQIYSIYSLYKHRQTYIYHEYPRGPEAHGKPRLCPSAHGAGPRGGVLLTLLGGERSILGKMEGPHPHRGDLGLGQRGEDPRACTGRVGVPHAAPSPTSSPHYCPPLLGEKGSVLPNSMLHWGRGVAPCLALNRARADGVGGWQKLWTAWMCWGRGRGEKTKTSNASPSCSCP